MTVGCRLCAFWSSLGECEKNPTYMQTNCAPSCFSCDKLIFEERCPLGDDPDADNVWKGGDLNAFFRRVAAAAGESGGEDSEYGTVTVLSSPDAPAGGRSRRRPPWVVTLDSFLTDEECDTLVDLGSRRGYERSEDVAATAEFDGSYGSVQSEARTSTNTWCLDECYDHPVTKRVLQRIENLTGIPDSHSEYLQLLKYEEG